MVVCVERMLHLHPRAGHDGASTVRVSYEWAETGETVCSPAVFVWVQAEIHLSRGIQLNTVKLAGARSSYGTS